MQDRSELRSSSFAFESSTSKARFDASAAWCSLVIFSSAPLITSRSCQRDVLRKWRGVGVSEPRRGRTRVET